MMPIVFCASLPPWPSEYAAADTSCSLRNRLSTFLGVDFTKIQATISMMIEPSTKPSSGATTMNATVLIRPPEISEPVPAFATAAPTRPPISACDDDEGMP